MRRFAMPECLGETQAGLHRPHGICSSHAAYRPSSVSTTPSTKSPLERFLRHRVKAGAILRQVALPCRCVPKLQMITHAYQDRFMSQAGKLDKTLRNQNPAAAIDVHGFRLGKIEPSENPGFFV